jgi:hypothetical protein
MTITYTITTLLDELNEGATPENPGGTGLSWMETMAYIAQHPAGADRDWIKDWASGDKIDLSEIDAVSGGTDNAFNYIGSGAFQNAGDLRVAVNGANTLVAGDVDGNGAADFTIVLSGVVALQAGDFIL